MKSTNIRIALDVTKKFQNSNVLVVLLYHIGTNTAKLTISSINCQRNDWKIHKLECKGFKKAFPNKPNTMLRIISRLLYTIHLHPELAIGLDIDDLESRLKVN